MQASGMPVSSRAHANKIICMNEMNIRQGGNKLLRQDLCSGYPLSFLKCANGTLLPLTLGGPFVRMKSSPRENFCHFAREAALTDVWTDRGAPPSRRTESRGSSDGLCQRAARQSREGAACRREERRFTAGEFAGETVVGILRIE